MWINHTVSLSLKSDIYLQMPVFRLNCCLNDCTSILSCILYYIYTIHQTKFLAHNGSNIYRSYFLENRWKNHRTVWVGGDLYRLHISNTPAKVRTPFRLPKAPIQPEPGHVKGSEGVNGKNISILKM